MRPYVIIVATSVELLESLVNLQILKKYIPQGGPVVYGRNSYILQAMIYKKPKSRIISEEESYP